MDIETKHRLQNVERDISELRSKTSRLPVQLAKVPVAESGNVIYAQATSNVTSGTPTFGFDNAIAIVGTAPTGGTGTAQNQYAQEYSDNDWVILSQLKDNGQWLTERGGTSGSQVVYFELTEDMTYGDAAKLAKPVDATGALDTGADAFYVVDDKLQFYGLAAASGEDGYRGFALRYIDDYTGGVPGYRIITLEGPAQWLIVELDAAYSISGTDCNVLADEPWGRPFRNQRVPATGVIVVEDDLDVATNSGIGEKWLVAWDEAEEHYIFIVSLTPPAGLQRGMVTSAISAATGFSPVNRGSGYVQFYTEGGSEDGSPVEVSNQFFDSFDERSVVWCDRSKDPPEIISVGCTTVPEE